MIKGTFLPPTSLRRDALAAGHKIIGAAVERGEALVREKRLKLARHARELRARIRGEERRRADLAARRAHVERALTLENERSQLYRDAHAECLELALAVCEQVLGTRCPQDHDLLARRIHEALSRIADQSRLAIYVHPDTLNVVRETLAREYPHTAHAISGRDDIANGNALIEGPMGRIEISWREHFHELATHLRTELTREAA